MYHPYFRGKQYELITIREMAQIIAGSGFHPIIEPVRESLNGLNKTLTALLEHDGRATVIVNPHHGDLAGSGDALTQLLKEQFADEHVSAGILLTNDMSVDDAIELRDEHAEHGPVFVHAGFTEAKTLATRLGRPTKDIAHVFFADSCGKLYQKHFAGANRVLLRDGFSKKRNADYSLIEPFSDLHATFRDEGMDGFGDFLVVGDGFSESGGPAYAVAIHLTYIDPDHDDSMFVYHFLSDRQDTPQDPAGKFAEALTNMLLTLDEEDSHVLETAAVREFRELHKDGHFPGLGYVKKLSMNHHIETLARYFQPIV